MRVFFELFMLLVLFAVLVGALVLVLDAEDKAEPHERGRHITWLVETIFGNRRG